MQTALNATPLPTLFFMPPAPSVGTTWHRTAATW